MPNLSVKQIKENCPHCNPDSFALKHPLYETKNFWVVCDVNPLIEGHILIIPKLHLSCIGEYPENLFVEFLKLYTGFSTFLKKEYGKISTFEHGKIGQTVFHSHVHLLPYAGKLEDIIPEGLTYLTKISSLNSLKNIYRKDKAYLFFSIDDNLWSVDIKLGKPGFFRDRFAKALGSAQRGNWKKMYQSPKIAVAVNKEIENLENRWKKSYEYK
ncbi:MAG: HIT family protein [Patescibacteria group bacterium]|nr:HIT family protein [Patescibacteria group bacterium]